MNRVHREPCGAIGCEFVAGPSVDEVRVQRLADEHRATAHRLNAVPSEAVEDASGHDDGCRCYPCGLKRRRVRWRNRTPQQRERDRVREARRVRRRLRITAPPRTLLDVDEATAAAVVASLPGRPAPNREAQERALEGLRRWRARWDQAVAETLEDARQAG